MERRPNRIDLRREFILNVWRCGGSRAVDRSELRRIQRVLGAESNGPARESPSAIARILADADAELRHPDIIEYDVEWRTKEFADNAVTFEAIDELLIGQPLSLPRAEMLIEKLEAGRSVNELRTKEMAISARRILEILAVDSTLSASERETQSEIVEWLKVWIQTPALFADWLDLRRRSAEFRKKFSDPSVNE